MPRLRLVIELDYDASEGDYGVSDPKEMARIDEQNIADDPNELMAMISTYGDDSELRWWIEPVSDEF